MEEENHGRDLETIPNSSRGRVKEDRKNEGKRVDSPDKSGHQKAAKRSK